MSTPPSASPDFLAYGAFVRHGPVALHAFVMLRRHEAGRARRTLSRARAALGIAPSVRMDARSLLPGTPPQGVRDEAEARRRLAAMVDALDAIPGLLRYAWTDLTDYPFPLDDTAEGQAALNTLGRVLREACFAVPPDGSQGPQAGDCEVVLPGTAARDSHAHAMALDLADLLAAACAVARGSAPGWQAHEVDRIRYRSWQEVRHRLEAKPAQPAASEA